MLIPRQITSTTIVNHVRHGRLLQCGAVYFGMYVKFYADMLFPFSRLSVGVPTDPIYGTTRGLAENWLTRRII